MNFLGIDAGQQGAAALIHADGVEILDWPGSETAAADSLSWLIECYGTPTLCVVEQQQAMGGDRFHTSSMAKLMINYGIWIGLVSAFKIPTRLVLPSRWKKGYLPAKADKAASVPVAARLFPSAILHGPRGGAKDGRADALLLADFARRLHLGETR
jgi:hypothetical protein